MSAVAHQYDAFARDYQWLYSDHVLTGEPFFETHKEFLQSVGTTAKILDCACGIGIQASALARHGYRVQGTDGSAGMVAEAQRRVAETELTVPFMRCSWEELGRMFEPSFDVAFCCGNSICHCRDEAEMVRSLQGVHAVLKEGGLLLLTSRNWERLCADKPRFQVLGLRVREGTRCIPMYVWNFRAQWPEAVLVELVLIFEQDGRTSYRCYPITCYPFRHGELLDRLEAAGFVDVRTVYGEAANGYTVTARRG